MEPGIACLRVFSHGYDWVFTSHDHEFIAWSCVDLFPDLIVSYHQSTVPCISVSVNANCGCWRLINRSTCEAQHRQSHRCQSSKTGLDVRTLLGWTCMYSTVGTGLERPFLAQLIGMWYIPSPTLSTNQANDQASPMRPLDDCA